MARSRNIKPGFFTNDLLAELPAITRLLFAGLWVIADRAGRIEDRPKKIRAEVMPYDDFDPDKALSDLEQAGFIARYEVGGVKAIQVLAWEKHQNPHIKEAASTLPALWEHQTSTVQEQFKEQPLPERAGLIPDSGFLIPDSSPLIPDSLGGDAQRERSAPTTETPVLEKQADPAKPAKPQATAKPDDVDDQTWADWLALRKAKRAPVSATVIDGARAEAGKAGLSLEAFLRVWCTRGSQGLMADWLKPDERSGANRIQSFAQQDAAEKRARWEAMTARKWPSADDVPEFIEAEKPTQKTVQRIAA